MSAHAMRMAGHAGVVDPWADRSDLSTVDREYALDDVRAERRRQDAKWGQQDHRDGTGNPGDGTSHARSALSSRV